MYILYTLNTYSMMIFADLKIPSKSRVFNSKVDEYNEVAYL